MTISLVYLGMMHFQYQVVKNWSQLRLTSRHLAKTAGPSHGTTAIIINDCLGLHKVSVKLGTPKTDVRLKAWELLLMFNSNTRTFRNRIATTDERWVHHLGQNPKSKANNGCNPSLPNFRFQTYIHMILWDAEWILLVDYLERGQ